MHKKVKTVHLIRIPESRRRDGRGVILKAGAVVWAGTPGYYYVEKAGMIALRKERIPFQDINETRT